MGINARMWLLLIMEVFLVCSLLLFAREVNQVTLRHAVREYQSNPTFEGKLLLNAKYAAAAQKRLYVTLWFVATISGNTALLIYFFRRRKRPSLLGKRRPTFSVDTISDCHVQ